MQRDVQKAIAGIASREQKIQERWLILHDGQSDLFMVLPIDCFKEGNGFLLHRQKRLKKMVEKEAISYSQSNWKESYCTDDSA